ncbi:MAG: hypothetical protein JXK07_03090 [Spirochaetes bacterium]|nr:hypothetical protein [Spirochaetota bacterium]MBN2771072.1 hypothetical protein [Spirochaetota bacterium]
MRKTSVFLSMALAALMIAGSLYSETYYTFRAGGGIAGAGDKIMGRDSEYVSSDGGDGPAIAVSVSASLLNIRSAKSSLFFGAQITANMSEIPVSSESEAPVSGSYNVYWTQNELDAKYIYSVSRTVGVFIGPRLLMNLSYGEYPLTNTESEYSDDFFYRDNLAGISAGFNLRKHLFGTSFIVSTIGYGALIGVNSTTYKNETVNGDQTNIMNSLSLGYAYYSVDSKTMFDVSVVAVFYLRDTPVMTSFDDGIETGRITLMAGVTRPFKN